MRRLTELSIMMGVCGIFLAHESPTKAAFVFTLAQSGNNVLVNGAGTLNVSALTFDTSLNAIAPTLFASESFLIAGPSGGATGWRYLGISGPSAFGPGRPPVSLIGTGDLVGIIFATDLYVPAGYVSGAYLTDSDVISNETFAGIGSTPGSYVYSWGSGPTADSLTINIGVVPEPASLAIVGVPATIALLRRRRGPG